MEGFMSRRSLFALAASAVVLVACSQSDTQQQAATPDAAAVAPATPGLSDADLAALRAASERFNDVKVALAEGYIEDPSGMCVIATEAGLTAEDGAMGIHYLRPDLLGLAQAPGRVNGTGTHMDFSKPAILMYEPQADGSLKLLGVENLVWAAAWKQAGNAEPPTFNGTPYNYMEDNPATPLDEAHGFEPHYDLHAWIYRDNPKGLFSSWNPAVSCAHGKHMAPKTGQP
jgi:hypothetical protein